MLPKSVLLANLIIGIMMHILYLCGWKNRVSGKDLFPALMNSLPINIILKDTKAQKYSKAILMLIIGKCALALRQRRSTFSMNGMTTTGWIREKKIIVFMHRGVFMKCIWKAGCDLIPTVKLL